MTRIILSGANGKMGKTIQSVVAGRENCEIVAGVDLNTQSDNFPIYDSIDKVQEQADVVIDFTNPVLIDGLLDYSKKTSTPLVIGTTGFNDNQKKQIEKVCEESAVFFTYNMSLGINLLANLAKKAADILGKDFDIEIVEKHHNQKIDAPSGTALMLADAICEEFDEPLKYEYDRHSKREKRSKNEIGMHSVRGGTIVGEHEIIFAGRDEIITLSHSARSKEIFAVGAVNAAEFMKDKSCGMYSMKDLIK
ncbi:MAG TPA: 4-hydroxy-tetrahydrodipicolinate reductase [Candidatus Eubacterium faecipullorum]|uniref:4-hydroxy-tetrahydrodipicolinate reductase n=1 Tax=Candidatus Eubacterium faecipullorum TaxID=2838571 RepID=A0A9D1UFG9_9FIRM|nr:4-hydroxy-tetrahydrodipicolinate reductase [Candidatus Eubacterium faecipullorum]